MVRIIKKSDDGIMTNNELCQQIKTEVLNIKGKNTKQVRAISAQGFKKIKNKDIKTVFELCEMLLEERKARLGIIAYDWAYRMKKDYDKTTFDIFERWLYKYIQDWYDCDDFCTHAFGELIAQDNSLFQNILKWTDSENFAVRRAAAVVLIYPIRKDRYQDIDPLIIAERLKFDEHDLVLKGYGWMLKVLSQMEPETVYHYIDKNKAVMPRVALRYAVEKMDKEKRKTLMKKPEG